MTREPVGGTAFLAFPGMRGLLASELLGRFSYRVDGSSARWHGDLLCCPDFVPVADAGGQPAVPYWACTALLSPERVRFESIGEAAAALRSVQRSWAPYQYQLFRRAALIQEKLPHVHLKARKFPCAVPNTPMGLYTLLDEKTMIAGARTTSPLPAGKIVFEEDHENPPSRAYLKLQESLTLFCTFFGAELPKAGDKCFDAGACPGGWTHVLRLLGADVLAVDRSELSPRLMADSHVSFLAHDAFTLSPSDVESRLGRVDWLFSDVICYPSRLYDWISMWVESKKARNIICTIKMQGEADWSLIKKFGEIENARIVHLNYNKHELTIMVRREVGDPEP